MNAYELATMAGCLAPDAEDTYGANWLSEIQWRAQARHGGASPTVVAQFMATSPPDWKAWKLYAELGGWKVSVYQTRITSGADMTNIARRALYHYSLKLATALIDTGVTA